MKTLVVILVCLTLCLGVFNAFWYEKNEQSFVQYVKQINLADAIGNFDAIENYARNMLGEVNMISANVDELADHVRAFEDIDDFGDGVLTVLKLLAEVVYFLCVMGFHVCVIIVIHVYSIVELLGDLFTFLLGL